MYRLLALPLTQPIDRHASERRGVSSWLGKSATEFSDGLCVGDAPRLNGIGSGLYGSGLSGYTLQIRSDKLGEAGGAAAAVPRSD